MRYWTDQPERQPERVVLAWLLWWAVAPLACTTDQMRSIDLLVSEPSAPADCFVPSDCPANKPLCALGLCVECSEDLHCDDKKPACHRGSCVQCVSARHCPAGSGCNLGLSICALSCVEPSDCAGQKDAQCDVSAGYCVACTSDEDCVGKKAACQASTGRCVECSSDAHCPNSLRCNAAARCVACLADADCEQAVCDLADNACVECRSDGDCKMGESCEGRRCTAACAFDTDCKTGQTCRTELGLCAECAMSSDCARPDRGVCHQQGRCVECVADADCADPTRPGCVQATSRCAPCTRDAHCGAGQRCDLARTECVAD